MNLLVMNTIFGVIIEVKIKVTRASAVLRLIKVFKKDMILLLKIKMRKEKKLREKGKKMKKINKRIYLDFHNCFKVDKNC